MTPVALDFLRATSVAGEKASFGVGCHLVILCAVNVGTRFLLKIKNALAYRRKIGRVGECTGPPHASLITAPVAHSKAGFGLAICGIFKVRTQLSLALQEPLTMKLDCEGRSQSRRNPTSCRSDLAMPLQKKSTKRHFRLRLSDESIQ
jgi:hypothetical protein